MHERVPRTFYFVVSSPAGVAETIFQVNFTLKHKGMSNSVDDDEEELSEPGNLEIVIYFRIRILYSFMLNDSIIFYLKLIFSVIEFSHSFFEI